MAQVWGILKPKSITNYLLDPSFEGSSGTTLVAWTVGGVGTTVPTTDSSTVKYGLHSLKLTGPKYVYQAPANLTPGAVYTASVWAFLVSGQGIFSCWNNGGAQALSLNITTAGQWLRYAMDFTCFTDGIIDVVLQANDNTTVIYYDAVQLELKDTGDVSVNGSLDQWASGSPYGWTSSNTTLVTQSTSPVYSGYSCAKITGNGTTLNQTTPPLANGTILTISFYARCSGAATLTITDAGSANQVVFNIPDTAGSFRQYTTTKVVVTSTATLIFGVNDTTSTVYIDSVTITPPGWWSNAATTYIDGDLVEEGGSWAGGPSGRFTTQSLRSDNNRRGGAIYNFDAFNTAVTAYEDFAYAPIRVISAPYATQDGAQYQTSFINERPLKIDLFIDGATEQDLGHQREGIKEALKLDLTPTRQECSLVYLGFGTMPQKVIRGAFVDGLRGKIAKSETGFYQETQLQFKCSDPYYYGFGNNAVSLYATQSITANGIIGKINNSWNTFNGGANGPIQVIKPDFQGNLIVGGQFSTIGGITTNCIAKVNIATGVWSGWGAGLDSNTRQINDIYVHGNGDIYIAGFFSSINGVAAANVAMLPAAGGAWTAQGSGTAGTAYTICFDGALTLYYGHVGTTAGGVTTNGFATWTIPSAAWGTSGTGVTGGIIYKIILLPGFRLAIAGSFTTFNGTSAPLATIYTPSAAIVTAFGTFNGNANPAANPICRTCILTPRGTVIFAGTFSAVSNGTVAANNIAEYNGTSLVPIGAGVTGTATNFTPTVYSLSYLPNGVLQVVGAFDTIRNAFGQAITANAFALWTGSEWKSPDITFSGNVAYCAVNSNFAGGATVYGLAGTITFTGLAVNVNVSVTGTAPTYPKLIFTGPGTLNSVTNATAKVTVNFNGYVMQAGEMVTVVFSPLTKTAQSSLNGGTDITAQLGSSDVASFRLLPNRVNQISCFISGTTSAATSATIYYQQVWDSGDGGA